MARLDPLAELVTALQRLPGIGARSAQRLAYHLLKTPREEVDALCAAMLSVKERVTYCSICSNITDVDPCAYCTAARSRRPRSSASSSSRRTSRAIEKTRGFRGRYHVLMGAIAPLQGIGPDDLKIKGLLARVAAGGVEEVILATNPTVEGEATALYLAQAAQAARRPRHAASRWACRSAAISTTRTSSRCRRRWKEGGRFRTAPKD